MLTSPLFAYLVFGGCTRASSPKSVEVTPRMPWPGAVLARMADLSEQLVESLSAAYGVHAGQRAAHAKGVLCAGRFTPAPDAAKLSTAPHFSEPTRTHVRFSNGSGTPSAPDNVRDGRGMAVKFYLPDDSKTDVVALSLPVFFTRTPEDLLAFN